MSHTADYNMLHDMFPRIGMETIKRVREGCASLEAATDALLLRPLPDAAETDLLSDCRKLQELFPSIEHTEIIETRRKSPDFDAAMQLLLSETEERRTQHAQARLAISAETAAQPTQAVPQNTQPPTPAPASVRREAANPVQVAGEFIGTAVGLFSTAARSISGSIHYPLRNRAAAPPPEAPPSQAPPQQVAPLDPPAPLPAAEPAPRQPQGNAHVYVAKLSLQQAKADLMSLLPEDESRDVERLFGAIRESINIAIVGKRCTGKTSILNAMLGQPLLVSKMPIPINYTVERNEASLLTAVTCNGNVVETDLADIPVGKTRGKMQEAVAAALEGSTPSSGATVEVKVSGRVVPKNIVLREYVLPETVTDVSFLSEFDVTVVVVNKMTEDEKALMRAVEASDDHRVLLVKTVSPHHLVEGGDDADILQIDPLMYLSALLLSTHQIDAPAYEGSFTQYKSLVHALIQRRRLEQEVEETQLWKEVQKLSDKKITAWGSIREYCTGVTADVLSRPPPCSDAPAVDHESPVLNSNDYTPAQLTYTPPEPYVPATNEYQPTVSTWQPSN